MSDSSSPPDLATFFSTMSRFLSRELSAESVEETLGACPSGRGRLDVYQWLVAGDIEGILSNVHLSVKRAMDRLEPGLWSKTIEAFWVAHPADHWEPARYGERMAEFLKADSSLPAYLHELADFHWTRYLCAVAVQPDDGNVMDRTVFIRQYAHSVPQYVRADDPDAELPTPAPTISLIFQSLKTLRPHALSPSLPTILALAHRTDTSPELRAQFPNVDAAALAEGDAVLVEHGVLPPLTA